MKYVFLALVIIFTPLVFASAQVTQSLVSQEATIDLSPLYPAPGETFTASLNDYSLSGSASSIRWEIDGEVISAAENTRSVSLTAKEAGESMVVKATIGLSTGGSMAVQKTVTPVYLDIVVEAQTRTPSFYQGRALPSIGSTINVTALLDGYATPMSNLLFTWRVNNTVIEGGSLRGKNKVSFPAPMGQLALLTLDVSNASGAVILRKTIEILSVKPTVYFYETSSLYGLKKRPVTALSLIGTSASVQAEPYNLDILTYNNPELLEWDIDGNRTTQSNGNPYEITLARDGGTGVSNVQFHVRNLTQLLQGSEGTFRVNY